MRPAPQWEEPVEIDAGRTCDRLFKLYKPNTRKAAALPANAVLRFKLADAADAATPLLDIDSVAALDGGSLVTIISAGTEDTDPARVQVRFGQDDTADLPAGDDYFGELIVVDPNEANPANAAKRAGYGPVSVLASPGGDIGLT